GWVWSRGTTPRERGVAQERQRSRVVWPAPDFPMTATNCPGWIVAERSTSAGAALPGKILATASSVTAGERSATMTGPTVDAPYCDFATGARRLRGEARAVRRP